MRDFGSGEDADRLLAILVALGEIGDERSVDVIFQRLDATTDEKLRARIVEVLEDVEVPEALAAVNAPRPGTARRPLGVFISLTAGGEVDDVAATELELPVDLKGRPFAWIGPASADDSLRLVRELYGQATRPRAQEDLVELAGLHDRPGAHDFLGERDERARRALQMLGSG